MESQRHWKGKVALSKILLEDDYTIWDDEYCLNMETEIGNRDYIIDIFAEKNGEYYAFEVDGKKGHTSKRDLYKMKIRDRSLVLCGVITIRIQLDDLIGKKKQPLEIIKAEITYQSIGQRA